MGRCRAGRKLAAILAADVAGYSRLTRTDEEGTIARLRTLRRELNGSSIDGDHHWVNHQDERHHRRIRRRSLILLIASVLIGPRRVRAQQFERVRRIGVLIGTAANTGVNAIATATFVHRLAELGWIDGRNCHIEIRWANGDPEIMHGEAVTLANLTPDVVMVMGNPAVVAFRPFAHEIPIVFTMVADPVSSGFVPSLSRPGGNITGFTNFEASMGGKWVEILKEVVPTLTRVVVLMVPETAAHVAFWRAAAAAAPRFGIEASAAPVHEAAEIEHAIAGLVAEPKPGVIALPHVVTEEHRDLIIALAAQRRLPTIFAFRPNAEAGALVSYGIDANDEVTRAADYVDRILRGEKPGDLPIQAATKFDLVINLKTAKAFGPTVPPALLAQADEVIE
jgi:putative tryptophan/tyrosine transport system substrate-binding protein